MKALNAAELAQWLADPKRDAPQLLDVREPWETQICRIAGAELMPMRTVPGELHRIDRDRPVVCICHHGRRSAHVALFLMQRGFTDIYNLTGGVDAWAREVDPSMPVY
ncbi:MAG: rhodanese-like domain-containing protein [Gemmatimonadota bacterium]